MNQVTYGLATEDAAHTFNAVRVKSFARNLHAPTVSWIMIVERLLRFAHINVRRFLSFVSLRYHFVCNRSGMFAANRFSKLKFILLHALLWVASTLGNRWHSGRKTLLQLRWSSITSYVRQSQHFYFQFQCQQRSLWGSNHCRTTICVEAIKFLLSFYWRNAARKNFRWKSRACYPPRVLRKSCLLESQFAFPQ